MFSPNVCCLLPSCRFRGFPEMVFDLTPTPKWEWWSGFLTIANQGV